MNMRIDRALFFIAIILISYGLMVAFTSTAWALAAQKPLSEAEATFLGEAADDCSGRAVDSGGDVNGDGYMDILIGAAENDEAGAAAGQAYLIFGHPHGWAMDTSLSEADASFRGERAGHLAGASVAFPGDVNGDGLDDILIGAPYFDTGG